MQMWDRNSCGRGISSCSGRGGTGVSSLWQKQDRNPTNPSPHTSSAPPEQAPLSWNLSALETPLFSQDFCVQPLQHPLSDRTPVGHDVTPRSGTWVAVAPGDSTATPPRSLPHRGPCPADADQKNRRKEGKEVKNKPLPPAVFRLFGKEKWPRPQVPCKIGFALLFSKF